MSSYANICHFMNLFQMAELMHQMRDPAHTLGGSVGSIPQSLLSSSGNSGELTFPKALGHGQGIHSTPATNLKLSEAVRNAQPDASPNLISSKMKSSKSYTHGLSNSAGTVSNCKFFNDNTNAFRFFSYILTINLKKKKSYVF